MQASGVALGVGPLVVVLVALLGEALLAGLPGLRTLFRAPADGVDAVVAGFEARLNRAERSAANRKFRGALVVVLIAGPAAAAGYYIAEVSRAVTEGWIIEAAAVSTMLAQRRALDLARRVRRALRRHGVGAGRAALARDAAYDTAALDEHAVARGAIEACATRLCDGLVAPIFWYILVGLPGLFVYRAVNVMAARIGVPTAHHAAFGLTAGRLDLVLNYLPAPFCGALFSIAALFVPGARPSRALRVMLRESRGHPSPVAGWTEGAMAGALGLALAGPRRYGSSASGGPWIGGGRARASVHDIGRAMFMLAVAGVIVAGIVALLALAMAEA